MIKKTLICTFTVMSIFILTMMSYKVGKESNAHPGCKIESGHVEPMPIVQTDVFKYLCAGGVPIEQRDSQVVDWLNTGLKLQVQSSSGSGTIVYFDPKDGYAYVQSCGHMWRGNMTAKEGLVRNVTCQLITWYHNDKKLAKPRSYAAQVLYYSNVRGRDCSLLRFKPDWTPHYYPIAPQNYQYTVGTYYHSVGCDSGYEVAHYNVRFIGIQGMYSDLTTTENSPRPGRSGGGLMTDDYYIGICWGTTDTLGRGNGFFTPINIVRDQNRINGYGWLNDIGINWSQKIPIIDRNNPQGNYPKDYIPVPQGPQFPQP